MKIYRTTNGKAKIEFGNDYSSRSKPFKLAIEILDFINQNDSLNGDLESITFNFIKAKKEIPIPTKIRFGKDEVTR